jgi:hypothetical protein
MARDRRESGDAQYNVAALNISRVIHLQDDSSGRRGYYYRISDTWKLSPVSLLLNATQEQEDIPTGCSFERNQHPLWFSTYFLVL